MELPSLEILDKTLCQKELSPSHPYLALDESAVSLAWDRCEDGRVLQRVAVLAAVDPRCILRATLGCVRIAASYELTCTKMFDFEKALEVIDEWIEHQSSPLAANLQTLARDAASWVKWTTGSSSAHAITDAIQLANALANQQLRHAPWLAYNAIEHSADAMTEDSLRAFGSPDTDRHVEERIKNRALAFCTQVVRELLPRPNTTAEQLRQRWIQTQT